VVTPGLASPRSYTPRYLAEKILGSRHALEGERKQVTVLFADVKGSLELLADRDPEDARKLLDPVLERMMEAVHRYEGTVNQVMGDGIMALFGAPLAHEDHAVRACRAAVRMHETVAGYADELRRAQGLDVQIRVGLNSGEVVVRAIGNDLHMDYSAIGQTTHLAARMEQMAMPESIVITPAVLGLAEGYVQVKPLGPVAVKGLSAPLEVYEVLGAGPIVRRSGARPSLRILHFSPSRPGHASRRHDASLSWQDPRRRQEAGQGAGGALPSRQVLPGPGYGSVPRSLTNGAHEVRQAGQSRPASGGVASSHGSRASPVWRRESVLATVGTDLA
jgi:class 3 adenylate cyclase